MARTKRKVNPLVSVPDEPVVAQRIYKTGAYIRLSVEDSGKPGADTIDAQKELVLGYVDSQPDMQFCDIYCDNGRTGTNFQRPEFDRIMDDVRSGKIDCIVVKDLSRFGRNYKETGNYLERIFPYLDVRFVAVNDNFDTLTAERTNDGYIVPLKNLINEVYSRDISRKSSSALAIKQQRGEFIGSWAPYGYRKSAEDKHRLEPDPETAPVLKNIFQWRLSGMGYLPIARRLNDQGIPCPSRLHYLRGEIKSERFAGSIWHVPILKIILRNQVYLGHTIQGRTKNDLAAGRKMCPVPQEDWAVVRNTHEPLVDEETFRKVQEIGETRRQEHNEKCGKFDGLGTTPNILKGLVYCAECGRTMARYKAVSERCGHRYYTYICRSHMESPSACPKRNLHETVLIEVLWDCLQREMTLAGNIAEQAKKYERSPAALDRKAELDRSISTAKRALSRYKRLHDSLYQNYVDGLMDELEFAEMKGQYQAEAERAQVQVEQLERQLSDLSTQTSANPWLQSFTRFAGATELTEGMAHALIQRIEVDKNENITIQLKYRDEYAMGDALLQKKFTTDTLPFKKKKNRGEKPQYYVENSNPPIVSKHGTDRTCEIFHIDVPVICPVCGSEMNRRHDSRFKKCQQRWICSNAECRTVIHKADSELLNDITVLLNWLIVNPELVQIPVEPAHEPSVQVRKAENEIARTLDALDYDKDVLRKKLIECVSMKYADIDSAPYITNKWKATLADAEPLSSFSLPLFKKTVQAIHLEKGGTVSIRLINDQMVAKDDENATGNGNAEKSGTEDTSQNRHR